MSASKGHSRPSVVPAAPGPDDGAAPAALPAALLAWGRTAPVALAAIAADGTVAWVNPAFERLAGLLSEQATGQPLETLLADANWPRWLPPPGTLARRRLLRRDATALHCDAQVDAIEGGLRLVTLVGRDDEARIDLEACRLKALLDFVQTHARIGLWERNVRTREGKWDPHMYRFFGIDPRHGPPSIAQIAQATVPQDRLFQVLDDSMRKAGSYSHRYRLFTADGGLRRVQAHWEV
ncbi:MAG TPA: PAS domain-containing protein, partial [Burkholderiaceae bacterium]